MADEVAQFFSNTSLGEPPAPPTPDVGNADVAKFFANTSGSVFADERIPAERRVQSFARAAAVAGRSHEDIDAQARELFPEADTGRVHQEFGLAQARQKFAGKEESAANYIGRKMLPGVSTGRGIGWQLRVNRAQAAYQKGEASPGDLDTLAEDEWMREKNRVYQKEMGFLPAAGDVAAGIVPVVGEMAIGPAKLLAKPIERGLARQVIAGGSAMKMVGGEAVPAASALGKFAAGGLTYPITVPALGPYQGAAQRAGEQGGDWTDRKNLMPAIGESHLKAAVFGAIQNQFAGLAFRPTRAAFQGLLGAVEAAGADLAANQLGFSPSKGEVIDDIIKGKYGDANRHFALQWLAFAGFAATHGRQEMGRPLTKEEIVEAAQKLKDDGATVGPDGKVVIGENVQVGPNVQIGGKGATAPEPAPEVPAGGLRSEIDSFMKGKPSPEPPAPEAKPGAKESVVPPPEPVAAPATLEATVRPHPLDSLSDQQVKEMAKELGLDARTATAKLREQLKTLVPAESLEPPKPTPTVADDHVTTLRDWLSAIEGGVPTMVPKRIEAAGEKLGVKYEGQDTPQTYAAKVRDALAGKPPEPPQTAGPLPPPKTPAGPGIVEPAKPQGPKPAPTEPPFAPGATVEKIAELLKQTPEWVLANRDSGPVKMAEAQLQTHDVLLGEGWGTPRGRGVAASEAARSGHDAVYVDFDVTNMSGLQRHAGSQEAAIAHVRAMGEILRAELAGTGADVKLFRHGADPMADELSAVVTGIPQRFADAALARAKEKIAAYVEQEGLHEIPHTKAGREPGTGIEYAAVPLTGRQPREAFAQAEAALSLKRKVPETPAGADVEATAEGVKKLLDSAGLSPRQRLLLDLRMEGDVPPTFKSLTTHEGLLSADGTPNSRQSLQQMEQAALMKVAKAHGGGEVPSISTLRTWAGKSVAKGKALPASELEGSEEPPTGPGDNKQQRLDDKETAQGYMEQWRTDPKAFVESIGKLDVSRGEFLAFLRMIPEADFLKIAPAAHEAAIAAAEREYENARREAAAGGDKSASLRGRYGERLQALANSIGHPDAGQGNANPTGNQTPTGLPPARGPGGANPLTGPLAPAVGKAARGVDAAEAARVKAEKAAALRLAEEKKASLLSTVIRDQGGFRWDREAQKYFGNPKEAAQYGLTPDLLTTNPHASSIDQLAQTLHEQGYIARPDPQLIVDMLQRKAPHGLAEQPEAWAKAEEDYYRRLQEEKDAVQAEAIRLFLNPEAAEEAVRTGEADGAAERLAEAQGSAAAGQGAILPRLGPSNVAGAAGLPAPPPTGQFERGGTQRARAAGPIGVGESIRPPQEFALAREKVTAERAERGQEAVPPSIARGNEAGWAAARQEMIQNPRAGYELVERILADPQSIRPDRDVPILLLHRVAISNAHDAAIREFNAAAGRMVMKEGRLTRQATDAELEPLRRKADDLEAARNQSDLAANAAGTQLGRGLQYYRQVARDDYSLGGMLAAAKFAKSGKTLTTEEKVEVERLHKDLTDANDKLKAAEEKLREAQEAVAALPPPVAPAPQPGFFSRAAAWVRNLFAPAEVAPQKSKAWEFADRLEQSALSELNSKLGVGGGKLFSGFDPSLIVPIAKYAAAKIIKSGLTLADFTAGLVKRFGESVRPHVEDIWQQAQSHAAAARKAAVATEKADTAGVADARIAVRKAKQKWGDNIQGIKDAERPPMFRAAKGIGEVFNAARAIITSFDFSAVLRQGGFVAFGHPLRAIKALPGMFHAAVSERAFDRQQDALMQRDNAELYLRSGLYLADKGGPQTAKEEAFIGRLAQRIPGVAASERAYTSFLNRVRADTFDALVAGLARNGRPTEAEAKAVANFVNEATGRGKLNTPFGSLENSAVPLATLFFSPRYVASRFRLLAGQPFYGGTAATRKAIAAEYVRYMAGVGVFLGLALAADDKSKLTLDPRSSDFGKLVMGQTRVDPLSGFSQVTALLGKGIAGEKTSTKTGAVQPLAGPGRPYGGQSFGNVAGKFVRSKFAPVPGVMADVLDRESFKGEPLTAPVDLPGGGRVPRGTGAAVAREASQLGVPLAARDVYDAMKDQGVPRGAGIGLLGIFGMGTQVHDPLKK